MDPCGRRWLRNSELLIRGFGVQVPGRRTRSDLVFLYFHYHRWWHFWLQLQLQPAASGQRYSRPASAASGISWRPASMFWLAGGLPAREGTTAVASREMLSWRRTGPLVRGFLIQVLGAHHSDNRSPGRSTATAAGPRRRNKLDDARTRNPTSASYKPRPSAAMVSGSVTFTRMRILSAHSNPKTC